MLVANVIVMLVIVIVVLVANTVVILNSVQLMKDCCYGQRNIQRC